MFEIGTHVKIEKLKASSNPEFPTPSSEEFKPGEDNGAVSLPVEYCATGALASKIEEGHRVRIFRNSRNNVHAIGYLKTSTVVKVEKKNDHLIFETENSIYKLTEEPEDAVE